MAETDPQRAAIVRMLRLRADAMARTRAFFAAHDVLEVDTPVLGDGVIVEANLDPPPCGEQFLLCSPEAPMKRLLAAGSGSIYQFAHAFRNGEVGARHAPEFTMLEWYRIDFDHHALMDEVEELVRVLVPDLGDARFERRTYRDLFVEHAGLDPFDTSLAEIRAACGRLSVLVPDSLPNGTIDDGLDLLLVTAIEPRLGSPVPVFVTDYPPSQAALARVVQDAEDSTVASRFELYIGGVEIANGYHELTDAAEQRRRFEEANAARRTRGAEELPVDTGFLRALDAGLPPCAGVALGFDRLLMVAAAVDEILDVRGLPFG